jgi:hypothetical protein
MLFLGFLFVPALQWQFRLVSVRSLDENRNRHQIADSNIVSFITDNESFTQAFEDYFNDHYGFRDFFIRCKNQIDYSLFGKSGKLLVGKEGWLFNKNHLEQTCVEIERKAPDKIHRVYRNLLAVDEYLSQRGIRFVVMPIPLKYSVYPEYLPTNTVNRPAETYFEKYVSHLDHGTHLTVINLPRLFQQAQKQYDLFPKMDFHWNDVGAFLAAREFIQQLGEGSSDVHAESQQEFGVEFVDFVGRQSFTLAIFDSLTERTPTVAKHWQDNWIREFGSEPYISVYHNKADIDNDASKLPAMLVFGDSFAGNFFDKTGLPNHFSVIYFTRHSKLKDLKQLLSDDVEVILLMHIESVLLNMFEEDWWPELD